MGKCLNKQNIHLQYMYIVLDLCPGSYWYKVCSQLRAVNCVCVCVCVCVVSYWEELCVHYVHVCAPFCYCCCLIVLQDYSPLGQNTLLSS